MVPNWQIKSGNYLEKKDWCITHLVHSIIHYWSKREDAFVASNCKSKKIIITIFSRTFPIDFKKQTLALAFVANKPQRSLSNLRSISRFKKKSLSIQRAYLFLRPAYLFLGAFNQPETHFSINPRGDWMTQRNTVPRQMYRESRWNTGRIDSSWAGDTTLEILGWNTTRRSRPSLSVNELPSRSIAIRMISTGVSTRKENFWIIGLQESKLPFTPNYYHAVSRIINSRNFCRFYEDILARSVFRATAVEWSRAERNWPFS